MESVVATVSGYHGSERFNLIKLISQAGASYVGALSRSTTHLVCWKFEGRKYNLAKKFRIIILNHQWVEDCIKQGRRVPEHPYMLQSGQEIGPLLMEVPILVEKDVLTKSHNVLSDRSNVCDDSEKQSFDVGCGGSGLAAWTGSFLLNEKLLPEFGKSIGSSHRSKPKSIKKTSKQEERSRDKYCFQVPFLSGIVRMEHEESSFNTSMHSMREKRKISKHEESSFHSSVHSAREKKKVFNGNESTSLVESSRTGRRLVKKNNGVDILQPALSEYNRDCYPVIHSRQNNLVAAPNHSDGERLGTSNYGLYNCEGIISEGSEDVEEIENWNCLPASNDSNSCAEIASTSLERTSQDGCSDMENLNRGIKDFNQSQYVTRVPTSMELSCVICWTDFSSTRGVLPCGHRFCYSCIQNWADHMASRRKISTCPLCKASFVSITKVEDAAPTDQKIYSQTIPYAPSEMDVFILADQEEPHFGTQSSQAMVCSQCRFREPEDLLISCHLCQNRCIHSYCLDPPLFPWTCIYCKDLHVLYHQTL